MFGTLVLTKYDSPRDKFNLIYKFETEKSIFAHYFKIIKIKKKFNLNNVYLASNDNLPKKNLNNNDVFIGVANLDSLNLINHHNKNIIFYDNNINQLTYIKSIIELIINCKTRTEFISILFSKEVNQIKKDINKLEQLNQKIWDLKQVKTKNNTFSTDLNETIHFYSNPLKIIKKDEKVVGALYSKGKVIGGLDFKLSFYENNLAKKNNFFYLVRKNGFLSSNENYDELRKIFLKNNTYIVDEKIDKIFYNKIFSIFRYNQISLWLSNIYSPYFYFKDVRKSFWYMIINIFVNKTPKLTILSDKRYNFIPEKINKNLTPHEVSFSKIIEVVNSSNKEIIEIFNDSESESLLPNASYIKISKLDNKIKQIKNKIVFLHMPLSKLDLSLEEIKNKIKTLVNNKNKIIILEFKDWADELSKEIKISKMENVYYNNEIRSHVLVIDEK